ncbi:unnamed protein product [Camellia sinensis]
MRKGVKNECPYSNENSPFKQYFSRSISTVICGTPISITVGLKRPNSNDGHQSVNSSGSNKGTDRDFCHSNSKQ